MRKEISKKEFETDEAKMNKLLKLVTIKGGFDNLTVYESAELEKYTQIVKAYE